MHSPLPHLVPHRPTRPVLVVLVTCTAVGLMVLAMTLVSNGHVPVLAQDGGEQASISISGPGEIVIGGSATYTVTANNIGTSYLVSYGMSITSSGDKIRGDSDCTTNLSKNFPVTESNNSRTVTVYGCWLGTGTLTAELGVGTPKGDYSVDTTTKDIEVVPIKARFSTSSHIVDEGDDRSITVRLNPATPKALSIPIEIAKQGSTQSSDFSVSGLNSGSLSFSSGEDRTSFTIQSNHDSDCNDQRIRFTFGTLPYGVVAESPSTTTVRIDDDERCPPTPTPTPIATPYITIVDLVDRLEEGETNNFQMGEYDDFQVVASNLNSRTNYMIKVTTNHSGAQFVSGCSDRETEFRVSGVTSYTADLTLYGCDGVNPAKVKAELLVGTAVIDTDTHDVIVFPAIAQPTITPQPPEKKNIILRYSSLSHNDFKYQASLFPNGLPVADTHTELFTVVTQRTITGPNVPGEYTVRIRACEDSTFANCGKYSASSNSLRKLMPPQDVDLTPHPLRMAVLSWNKPPNEAVQYKFSVTYPGATSPHGLGKLSGNSFTRDIDLDNVVNPLGLADKDYFEFRIEPVPRSGVTSYLAAEKTRYRIIDTPITVANGHSLGSNGQAELSWLNIEHEDVLDDSTFAGGTYSFRYRKEGGTHTSLGWQPGTYITDETAVEADLIGSDANTIGGLDKGEIYAIQLRYAKAGAPTVFAARDVYVWPSGRAAGNGERVATFPLHSPVPKGTTAKGVYEYRICDAPIPGGMTVVNSDWKDAVRHALEQWEVATTHDPATNDPLVEMIPVNQPCSNFNTLTDPTNKASDTLLVAVEKKIAASGSTVDVEAVTTFAKGYLTSVLALTQATRDDHNWNEVRIIHPGDFPELQSVANGIAMIPPIVVNSAKFPGLAREVGLSSCIFGNSRGCAQRYPGVRSMPLQSTDIFINQRKVGTTAPSLPGGDTTAERGDVPFNKCPTSRHVAYQTLVHEAGHALGIRGQGPKGYDRSHPSFAKGPITSLLPDGDPWNSAESRITAMSWNADDELRCSPHPFDILAIYALYQSR